MKNSIMIATYMVAIIACGSGSQQIRSFIYDQEHALDPRESYSLDSLFRAHERRTGNEITLVTTRSFEGKKAVDFAVAFGDSMGVGKKGHDNGVTIAFSKAERAVFIATGYGTERVLHDSICKRIVDEMMVPRFKEGRYFDGLWAGGLSVVEFLEQPGNKIR